MTTNRSTLEDQPASRVPRISFPGYKFNSDSILTLFIQLGTCRICPFEVQCMAILGGINPSIYPGTSSIKASVTETVVCTWNDACPARCRSEQMATSVMSETRLISSARCLTRQRLVHQARHFVTFTRRQTGRRI